MNRILSCILIATAAARAESALDEAKEHFTAGRFDRAIEAASSVGEREADYARARYLMGEIRLLLDDRKAAEADFRAADAAKPGSTAILIGLGRTLLLDAKYDEAEAVLYRAAKADPGSGRARCFLGIARYHASYGKRGRPDIQAGAKLAPKDPEIARAIVLAWLDEGKQSKAAAEARRFAKAAPKHPMGPFLQALVHEQEEEFDEAIKAYEKALERDGTFIDAHKNLAILCIAQNPMYKDKKRTEKAFEHFRRYEELGGRDEEVRKIHATLKKFFSR